MKRRRSGATLHALGTGGIGGKVSAGYGAFSIEGM